MKNNDVIPDLKGRKFNGNLSKIKRIRILLRQRIRQLLRSFVPSKFRVARLNLVSKPNN
jgi:hypothetical protein